MPKPRLGVGGLNVLNKDRLDQKYLLLLEANKVQHKLEGVFNRDYKELLIKEKQRI